MRKATVFFLLISWSVAAISGEVVKIDAGEGRYVLVPVPAGFMALGNRSPGFRAFSEEAEAPNNILLEMFLKKQDMASVLAGNSGSRDRELKIESLRSLFGKDLTKEEFEGVVAKIRASPKAIVYPEKEMNEFLSRQPEHYAGDPPRASDSKQLGKFMDEPYGVGITTCAIIINSIGSDKRCVSQAVLMVRKRALLLSVVARIHGKSDIDWIVNTAKSWSSQIVAANNSPRPPT